MTDIRNHPDEAQLAALLDSSLIESDAQTIRRHLASCAACRDQLELLRRLVADLQTPTEPPATFVDDVVRRATAMPDRPTQRRWLVGAAAAAALAGAVLLVWPMPPTSDFASRGNRSTELASVHFGLFQAIAGVTAARRLAMGDRVSAAALAFAVDVHYLPAADYRYIAIFARDAQNRVTWLVPVWLSDDESPGCLALPSKAGSLPADRAVQLDAVAPGPLAVTLLVFAEPCSIPAIDQRLEHGWDPADGNERGLVSVERVDLLVEE